MIKTETMRTGTRRRNRKRKTIITLLPEVHVRNKSETLYGAKPPRIVRIPLSASGIRIKGREFPMRNSGAVDLALWDINYAMKGIIHI